MAGGGLMQLVAYGAQDVYLSGKPEITFFKAVYKRHTNFAIEAISNVFSGNPDFGKTVTCSITRNGDLLTRMYLHVKVQGNDLGNNKEKWSWASNLGHTMINYVELEIGGSKIDKQYGDWMNIWHSLSRNNNHDDAYDDMVGNGVDYNVLTDGKRDAKELFIPLQFFCCRNNGLALPLIALQYHDVRLNVNFKEGKECVNYSGATVPTVSITSCELLVDFVFLDTDERKRFAQSSHEYLIEQLQYTGAETISANTTNVKASLNFNHPCKALFWVAQRTAWTDRTVKFAAWDPNPEKLQELATKYTLAHRARTAQIGDNPQSFLSAAVDATTTESYKIGGNVEVAAGTYQMVNVTGALTLLAAVITDAASFAAFQPDDYVITGELLPMSVISQGLKKCIDYVNGVTDATSAVTHGVTVNLSNNYGSNIDGSGNPFSKGKLILNGHDRIKEMEGAYFNYVQPYQHFSNTPSDGINVYSFAVNPEEHQPSGTCNMSRIDNAQLSLTHSGDASTLKVYAVNYNVLRVMSGMGGLAYSN